uniref:long-chain-fatty-acid--CoA ligase n=2 Tax=Sphaeramia orbicularis TaxID=375764 RepID=A0A673AHI4_9TELE
KDMDMYSQQPVNMLLWAAAVLFLLVLAFFFRNPYFVQDVRYVLSRVKIGSLMLKCIQTNFTLLDHFLKVVKAQPDKMFLYFQDESFTYKQADDLSTKAGRAFLQSGLVQQGDTVALFLRNEPVFLWLWFGLLKIGCCGAFLNYNMRSKSLLHCFNLSRAKVLVAAEELLDAVEEILPSLLEQQVTVYVVADRCTTAGVENFNEKMDRASSEPLPKDLRSNVTLQSHAAYIYTSGTTGLPKAVSMSHGKVWGVTLFSSLLGTNSEDVTYVSLPLYHTSALAALSGAIYAGGTMALRNKFSVSQFWDDCRKYNVTVIQYIGETMRYLCNTPKKPNDRSHNVRLAFGNGIRADVWREFLNRFGNIEVREFYGATEGNFSLLNYSGKIGAVGRHTFLHKKVCPYAVVKYDIYKEEPIRNSSGFCIEADKGEPGLFISKITLRTPFLGYVGDLKQTEKKRLHNVFEQGDMYLNSGDLLRIDGDGFVYFQDRVGDTFRWKGENVATTEVADIITMVDCIKEANVYGVEIQGQEGRAGMAAITLTEGQQFDSAGVFKHVESFLPSYARPLFFRIQDTLEVTGTYKHQKVKLVKEGFDPNGITDPLYVMDKRQNNYVPLTLNIYNSITLGKINM